MHATGRLSEAASSFRRFLALEPEAAKIHTTLGDVLAALGDPAGAVREYEVALGLGFDAPLVRAVLGSALSAAGRWEAAESGCARPCTGIPGWPGGSGYVVLYYVD